MTRILSIGLAVLVSGCASYVDPVPDDYTGETALINDTFEQPFAGRGYFFYLEEVDGQPVENAKYKTERHTFGQGRSLLGTGYIREVPAQPLTLKLTARRLESRPIAYGMTNYERSEGEVELTPQPGQFYLVRGIVTQEFAAVWVEDIQGNRVTRVIESTSLGRDGAAPYRASIPTRAEAGEDFTREDAFATIRGGEHYRVVTAKIGEPDETDYEPAVPFSNKLTDMTTFHYADLGTIVFNTFDDDSFAAEVTLTTRSAESLTPDAFERRLDTWNGHIIRHEIQELYRNELKDREILDVAAQRLWEGRHAEDDPMLDAMAWICQLLGQSGDARYRELLDEVAEISEVRKLHRHAANNRERLREGSDEPFRPAADEEPG